MVAWLLHNPEAQHVLYNDPKVLYCSSVQERHLDTLDTVQILQFYPSALERFIENYCSYSPALRPSQPRNLDAPRNRVGGKQTAYNFSVSIY